MKLGSIAIVACLLLSGCGINQVTIVGGDTPVQLAEDVNAYVYVKDAQGNKVKSTNRVKIPQGFVCFPPALVNPSTQP